MQVNITIPIMYIQKWTPINSGENLFSKPLNDKL